MSKAVNAKKNKGASLSVFENCYEVNLQNFSDYARGDFGEALVGSKKKSWEWLQEKGLPTTKNEAWKYSNLAPVFKGNVGPVPHVEVGAVEAVSQVQKVYRDDFYNVVFVNGIYIPSLSIGVNTNRDWYVFSFSELSMGFRPDSVFSESLWKSFFSSEVSYEMDHLNQCLSEDGYFFYVPKNVKLDRPLQIINVCLGDVADSFNVAPRNLVHLETGAECEVIETYINASDSQFIVNAVTAAHVGEGAKLSLGQKVQGGKAHFSNVKASVDRSGVFDYLNLSAHSQFIRNDVKVDILGEGGEAYLNGLFVANEDQHIDNHTEIIHHKPHGVSRQLYKGILDDSSRGVFNGKIHIVRDAQKTDSSQLNQNLLLSNKAEIDSKPELEVYADDVKANHGSASGQLDHSEVFYFQSRGISREEAVAMISKGYAFDVVYKSQSANLQKYFSEFIEEMDW